MKQCPNYPILCPNQCGAWGLTRSTVPAHLELCSMQCVDCEYKGVGCATVLLRKDMAVHLQTSVEEHLQMTKRKVEEQEVCLRKEKAERQIMESQAEMERQRMNDVIARLADRVEQLELKK